MENLPLIIKNISHSKRVAVALPEQATADGFCAAIALQAALPNATLVTAAPLPELKFLPRIPSVVTGLIGGNQLAIKISNKTTEPKEIRYEKSSDGLTVFVTPTEGQFKEEDVSVMPSASNFDLVIIIGAANFEQLGKIYTDNTKLFFETPHINIDNNPGNEFYGTINYIDAIASSLSEVVMDIIKALPAGLSGPASSDIITTALLGGIISQTASFRDPKTTPSALQKASRLVAAGARQQDIIQQLFKTKSLPLLQLWGRALARLTAEPEKQVLTAMVTASDLEKTKMAVDSLPLVLKDILEMVTGYSLIVFLAELPAGQGVQVLLAGLPFEKLIQFVEQISSEAKILTKPTVLLGKYQYISAHVMGTLPEMQMKVSQLVESR